MTGKGKRTVFRGEPGGLSFLSCLRVIRLFQPETSRTTREIRSQLRGKRAGERCSEAVGGRKSTDLSLKITDSFESNQPQTATIPGKKQKTTVPAIHELFVSLNLFPNLQSYRMNINKTGNSPE
jgi:hypothetical protein